MCGSRLDAGEPNRAGLPGEWSTRLRLDGVRDRARYAVAIVQTWSGARRELGVIDAELRRLHGERHQLLTALGDATYRGDEEAAAQSRDDIRSIDEQIEQEHEKERRVVEEASARIGDERESVAPTQIVSDPESDRKETE
jgi:hypothetical protein